MVSTSCRKCTLLTRTQIMLKQKENGLLRPGIRYGIESRSEYRSMALHMVADIGLSPNVSIRAHYQPSSSALWPPLVPLQTRRPGANIYTSRDLDLQWATHRSRAGSQVDLATLGLRLQSSLAASALLPPTLTATPHASTGCLRYSPAGLGMMELIGNLQVDPGPGPGHSRWFGPLSPPAH